MAHPRVEFRVLARCGELPLNLSPLYTAPRRRFFRMGMNDDDASGVGPMETRSGAGPDHRSLLGDAAGGAEDHARTTRSDHADLVSFPGRCAGAGALAWYSRRHGGVRHARSPPLDAADGRCADAYRQLRVLPARRAAHLTGECAAADPARAPADGAGRHLRFPRILPAGTMAGSGD